MWFQLKTPISPLLTLESPVQYRVSRYIKGGLWVQKPSRTKIFSRVHAITTGMKLDKCLYLYCLFRRFSVQDESTGSILSPSDISYDNTEEDLVKILLLHVF